ncbi:hypothetical protein EZV62_007682 [Acer yangbiense]|uniref:Uncharacterized protein n=1 Tax=Acer yangbiense TaxID=1000413 RepID=A0A5C7IB30_9ROSI|nr:hypothetical protein EZV62_007682 [Acer yangbiense]
MRSVALESYFRDEHNGIIRTAIRALRNFWTLSKPKLKLSRTFSGAELLLAAYLPNLVYNRADNLLSLMAEEESSKVNFPQPPPFLEVECKISGKTSRYAAGTKAGFAVNLINKKLDCVRHLALHIEAVKQGEEPISFGPDALLVDYGDGWKLQTVTQLDSTATWNGEGVGQIPQRIPEAMDSECGRPIYRVSKPGISVVYIGKILLAVILMFMLGALFTVALENLPKFILFVNVYVITSVIL